MGLFHMLVVELRHEQAWGPRGADHQKKGPFQRLEARASQIIDAIERSNNEKIEPRALHAGLQGFDSLPVLVRRDPHDLSGAHQYYISFDRTPASIYKY